MPSMRKKLVGLSNIASAGHAHTLHHKLSQPKSEEISIIYKTATQLRNSYEWQPTSRENGRMSQIGSQVFLYGGRGHTIYQDVSVLDTMTSTWSKCECAGEY